MGFHLLQWIALNIFGKKTHQKVVDLLQWFLSKALLILGIPIRSEGFRSIESIQGKPVIIVANHQSMFDIPPIGWYCRKLGMTYIAKKSLGRGVPSLSFNIKHGDSIVIDRQNPKESEQDIRNFAKVLKAKNKAVLFFPEGTRSRNGKPKAFKRRGLQYLLDEIPEALVLPVTVNNSWKIFQYGAFPFGVFNPLRFTFHEPLSLEQFSSIDNLIDAAEQTIKRDVTE